MPEPIQTTEPAPEDPEPDTQAEFHSLYTDADEGRARLETLAKAADTAGQPEIAKVYRELAGTAMTLMMDLAAATGGALVTLEDDMGDLERGAGGGAAPEESGLLQEDADKYLQLFEQFTKLLDGLAPFVPVGAEGDQQREVFATLRRMTDGMSEFTRSIIIDDDEPEEPEDPEEEPEEA